MVAQFLYVFVGGAIRSLGHLGYVVQQRPFGSGQPGLIQIALGDGLYGGRFCSLNPQEVRMRVESVRTAVEPRNPACDGFLGPAREMALGKMHHVAEPHHFAQKVGPVAEALQDAGHLLAAGLGTPFLIDAGHFAAGVLVFDQADLGRVIGHRGLGLAMRSSYTTGRSGYDIHR